MARFSYATNGGSDTVAGFSITATGTRSSVGAAVAAGTTPSHLSVDPTGCFVYVTKPLVGYCLWLHDQPGRGALTLLSTTSVNATALAFDPMGRFLYSANFSDTVHGYPIDAVTGALGSLSASNLLGVNIDPQSIIMVSTLLAP